MQTSGTGLCGMEAHPETSARTRDTAGHTGPHKPRQKKPALRQATFPGKDAFASAREATTGTGMQT